MAVLPPAVAQEVRRMSQAAAAYQDHPQNGFRCALCTAFRAPRSCLIVEGRISPNGWCKFFDLGD